VIPPVLITAGSTRNPIDAMRHIAAFSTGKTGVRLAELLQAGGAVVHLMGSPEALLRVDPDVSSEGFSSTRDLMARMHLFLSENPTAWVIHAAAVGDYEVEPSAEKLASGQDELLLRLRPTPKIIHHIKQWAPESRLVGFKAAGPGTSKEALVGLCRDLIESNGASLVLGNVIGSLENTATLVDERSEERFSVREEAFAALCERILSA